MKNIGNTIKEYFKTKKLTQQDVADKLNKSQPQIAAYLNGKNIGKNMAKELSEAFGFDYHFLLTGEGTLFPEDNKIVEATDRDMEEGKAPDSAEYWKAKYEAAQEEIVRLNDLLRIALGGTTQKEMVG